MNTRRNKQVMEEIFAALAKGDRGPFAAAMSDDVEWTIAGVEHEWAGTWRGRDEVRGGLMAALFAQLADGYTNTAVSFTAEGDRVVVEGRGRVETRTGSRYDNQYCYVFRFGDDGLLASVVEYADTALMQAVLSAPPR